MIEIEKPDNLKYIPLKTLEPYKTFRKQLADTYRLMRRDKASLARLIYKRSKQMEKELSKIMFNQLMRK